MSNNLLLENYWRARRKDNEQWVKGVYIPGPNKNNSQKHYILSGVDDLTPIEILPDTLNRCSGLRDSNSVLIFSGDVVLVPDEKQEGTIYWDQGAARFAIFFEDHTADFADYLSESLTVLRTVQED